VASRVTARHVSRLDVSGRSANPLTRGSAATKEKKGRKRTRRQECAGNEETALFDIVNRKRRGAMHRQGAGAPSRQRQRARVPAERAPRRALCSEVGVARVSPLLPFSCPGRAERDPGPRGHTTTVPRSRYCLRAFSCAGSRLHPLGQVASLLSPGTRERSTATPPWCRRAGRLSPISRFRLARRLRTPRGSPRSAKSRARRAAT